MTKINRELESRYNGKIDFNLGTISALMISGILTLTPMRAVGFIGLGSIGGAVVASVTTRRKLLEVSSQMLSEQSQLIDSKTDTYEALFVEHNTLLEKAKNLKNVGEQVLKLQSELETAIAEKTTLDRSVNDLTASLNTLRGNEKADFADCKTATLEAMKERSEALINQINVDNRHYKEITEIVERYTRFVDDAPTLVEIFDYLHWVTDELANCKVRVVRSSMIVRLQEYAHLYEEYQKEESIPKTQLDHERKNFQAQIAEYRLANSQFQQSVMDTVAEIEGQTVDDDKFVTGLINQMKGLEAKIIQLSKPIKYVAATRNDMKVSNIIIDFFGHQGLIIDRAGTTFRDYEADLEFITDRTGRLVLASELNKHSEALQALTHLINPIEFKLDPESGLITLKAQFYKKPKTETSEADIARLWRTNDHFEEIVKKWERIRITGGSKKGKSPTAQNIANVIVSNRNAQVVLFNPQENSVKNFWDFEAIGESHSDSEKGLKELARRVNEDAPSKRFELQIFDEVDSTIAQFKGKQSVLSGYIKTIIKQGSHNNLGVILIGQNANVKMFSDFDRSDMNNLVVLHLGANAFDAIQNTNRFSNDEQVSLKGIANKLTAYCNSKNEELGFDDSSPNAYRFGLVLDGEKPPFFIEVPIFGKYSGNVKKAPNSSAKPCHRLPEENRSNDHISTFGAATGVLPNLGIVTPMPNATKTPKMTCPGCGSTEVRSSGKNWRCVNVDHKKTAPNYPKNWKKEE